MSAPKPCASFRVARSTFDDSVAFILSRPGRPDVALVSSIPTSTLLAGEVDGLISILGRVYAEGRRDAKMEGGEG